MPGFLLPNNTRGFYMLKRRVMQSVFAFGFSVFVVSCAPTANGVRVGEVKKAEIGNFAPELTLENLAGKKVSLTQLRGQPILLNFWATWCGPCRREMPTLDGISKRYSSKGLVVIGVDVNERRNLVETFLKDTPVGYDVWLEGIGSDKTAEIVSKMEGRNGSYFIPFSVFIDRAGVIFSTVEGSDLAQLEAQAQAITR
jgi:thiol-disulfide isomerase/thioredoxin